MSPFLRNFSPQWHANHIPINDMLHFLTMKKKNEYEIGLSLFAAF